MYIGLYVMYPLFLFDFNKTWDFLGFSKNTQIPNFKKILLVAAELFHADRRTDGRTDGQNEIVPFRNFANAPKNVSMSAVILQLKVLQQFLPFVFRIKAMK